ncbi:MAG: nucleotidyltransferase domain-containing protein [Clostridia bacterium]|nr:nucleotidyltransferase domain-containing protein [Clostridia bacterium]
MIFVTKKQNPIFSFSILFLLFYMFSSPCSAMHSSTAHQQTYSIASPSSVDWKDKLNKFVDTLDYKDDIIGILACGSYVTGHPSAHSDLDVHIILKDDVKYRERGNKFVDGLLIEYFSNSPTQIRQYFRDDYKNMRTNSWVQFITGDIILDKVGVVKQLKDEAQAFFDRGFSEMDTSIGLLKRYELWDMLDDLHDAFETSRVDFDFMYYTNLDKLIATYMKLVKMPYNKKTILGNITSDIVRAKYLLSTLPHDFISESIQACILAKSRDDKIESYQKLTDQVMMLCGGFNIDGFKCKSSTDF